MFSIYINNSQNENEGKKDEKKKQNEEKDDIINNNIINDNNKEENDDDNDDIENKLKSLEEIRKERRRIPDNVFKEKIKNSFIKKH